MTSPIRLPLVVGVTGHRDLCPENGPPLTKCVLAVLQDLGRKHRHTPVVVLSALAEGADRLAADAALAAGARLFVPLPLPVHLYEQDFKTAESLAAFRRLLGRAERVFVAPYVGDNDDTNVANPARRVLQYAAAGAVIAGRSQVLLALWDGEDSPKVGGTAHVVRFRREGAPPPYGPAVSPLDPVETGALCHVVTPRQSNPTPHGRPFTWDPHYLRGHEAVLRHIDAFNRDAGRHGPRLQRKQAATRQEVLPAAALAELPVEVGAPAAVLRDGYGLADALALHFQARARQARFVVFLLAFLAAVLFKTAFWLPEEAWVRHGYEATAGLLVAAGALAWFLSYHARRLAYRALAEGLRVQLFWRLTGVAALAPDRYLRVQRRGLEWVRVALRNATLLAEPGGGGAAGPTGLALAAEYWVRAQQAYFERSAKRDLQKHRRLHLGRYVAFAVGLLWVAIRVTAPMTGWFPEPAHGAAAALGLGPAAARILINVNVLMGASLLIGGGMLIAYGKARGFDKHARRYHSMFVIFSNMRRYLERQPPPPDDEVREHLRTLGADALRETGEWALIEEREVEPRPA